MKHALEQHKRGEARVIPVILRPTNWIASPLGMFSPLPRYERPITTWQNRDEAFFEIAEGIRKVVKDLSFSESTLADSPASAVIPFVETSSHSFSQTSYARRIFGKLLLFTGRYEAALRSYEQALRIQPGNPYLYLGKGRALLGLKRNNEALTAYQGAIRLSPDLSAAYEGQGKAYEQLAQQTYEELQEQARTCHEKAKQLGVE